MSHIKKQQKGMHPEEIKAAIRMRGVTLGALSESWGFHKTAIGHALRRELPQVEAHIAQFLGKSLHDIWPDRYTPENIRIHCLTKRNRKNSKSHSQN